MQTFPSYQETQAALNRSALYSSLELESLDLEQTIAAYLNGHASPDEVAQAFYRSSRVNRLVAHACQKYRAYISLDFAQEIKQELAVLLTQKFLLTIESPAAIYNVLHVSACFMARRRAERVCEDSLEQILESSEAVPDYGHLDPVQELEDRIDHRRAVEDFNRRASIQSEPKDNAVPMARAATQVKPPVSKEPTEPLSLITPISMPASRTSTRGKTKVLASGELATPLRIYFDLEDVQVVERVVKLRPKRQRNGPAGPTPRSMEIKAIREEMHLSIEAFAELLGVKKPMMTAYIYGHLYPPERILTEARLLQRNQSAEIRELASRFEGVPMAQIIDCWLEVLGLLSAGRAQAPADAKLGELLRLSRVTIWRWRHEKMRPELRDIAAFDALIRKRAASTSPSPGDGQVQVA